MRTISMYHDMLSDIQGKVIALIYNFRNEPAPGYKIYEAWQGDVISSWMLAADELGAVTLVLDARTFVSKIINSTMPHVDYVVNLCNGLENIDVLGVVPSTCAFASLPCIPNNAKTIMIGEDKRLSNYLASFSGMKTPNEHSINDSNGIVRPISLGSSIGVVKTPCVCPQYDFICQEFIEGYDITIPIMINPILEDFEVLPGILYLPKDNDPKWFLGEEEKISHNKYEKVGIKIPKSVQEHLIKIAKLFQVDTYCRIDTRVRTSAILSIENLQDFAFEIDDLFFLEINTMPTIKNGINFHTSIAHLMPEDNLYSTLMQYRSHFKNPTVTGFILSSSILAVNSKAKR